ncbi:hypothetical protein ACVR05_06165 [Streptococcus caprae]|uniref:Uncharacterized protein n=1 Tax=Streptococcus caprae TaxID=1640501 RepID=A0ABV8CVJ6_9STRE
MKSNSQKSEPLRNSLPEEFVAFASHNELQKKREETLEAVAAINGDVIIKLMKRKVRPYTDYLTNSNEKLGIRLKYDSRGKVEEKRLFLDVYDKVTSKIVMTFIIVGADLRKASMQTYWFQREYTSTELTHIVYFMDELTQDMNGLCFIYYRDHKIHPLLDYLTFLDEQEEKLNVSLKTSESPDDSYDADEGFIVPVRIVENK